MESTMSGMTVREFSDLPLCVQHLARCRSSMNRSELMPLALGFDDQGNLSPAMAVLKSDEYGDMPMDRQVQLFCIRAAALFHITEMAVGIEAYMKVMGGRKAGKLGVGAQVSAFTVVYMKPGVRRTFALEMQDDGRVQGEILEAEPHHTILPAIARVPEWAYASSIVSDAGDFWCRPGAAFTVRPKYSVNL